MRLMNFSLNLLTNKFTRNAKRGGKQLNPQKVFVGISGGVDSAVSAILLKEAGYDVTGVFIRTWQPDFIECTWRDERRDAIRVCAHLNIPFLECDAENEYKNLVGMQMVNDYVAGLTPNPDILCNREVKFGVFWNFAKQHGADFIATGHYAKNITPPWPSPKLGEGESQDASPVETLKGGVLARPKDRFKDQTYFLWTLQNTDLEHVLFPLSDLNKDEVRVIAQKHNLPNATKKDSQGVCFLGHIDMKDFLSHYTELKQGDVLDEVGNVIGKHDGAIVYTLGQRHGFEVFKKTNNEKPYYIIAKNAELNTITVSTEIVNTAFAKKEHLLTKGFIRKDIENNAETFGLYRYNGEFVKIEVLNELNNDKIQVIFEKPVLISPGQSVVFYQKDMVIGGGVCL